MRGAIDGLLSPHPIGTRLPGLYQDDDVAQRFTAGLDGALAPVFTTLDALDAYLDPRLAPADFVEWLSGWVGIDLDGSWPIERQRALVAGAGELYTWQGTARGLTALVEIYTGVVPEIEESGGCTWSAIPDGDLPGTSERGLSVRVRLTHDGPVVDTSKLERLVAGAVPAHLPCRVEVIEP